MFQKVKIDGNFVDLHWNRKCNHHVCNGRQARTNCN